MFCGIILALPLSGFFLSGFFLSGFAFCGFLLGRFPFCCFGGGFFSLFEVNDHGFGGSFDQPDGVDAIDASAVSLSGSDDFVICSSQAPAPLAAAIFIDFVFHNFIPYEFG